MSGRAVTNHELQYDLRAIENASVRMWPAHERQAIGGWLWRYSNGGSQRANSVATVGDPGPDMRAAIEKAESLYRARSAPAQFQITEATTPVSLDDDLAARGYKVCDPCTTLACRVTSGDTFAAATQPGLEVRDHLTSEWFDAYVSVITPDRRAHARAILERVPPPYAFVGLRRSGEMIATTLCVVGDRIARVKCVATRANARRTGAAEAVVATAMAWGAGHGAGTIALGATVSNAAAQALYAKLGFEIAGRYHIRAKDV